VSLDKGEDGVVREMLDRRRARSGISSCVMFHLNKQTRKNEEQERTRRNVRGSNDACEYRLTCRQRPFSVPATGMVVFVVVFRLDVAAELFVVVNCAGNGEVELAIDLRRALHCLDSCAHCTLAADQRGIGIAFVPSPGTLLSQ
jgi:hypothetical protein